MSPTKREEGRGRERERFIETDNWGLQIGTAMHCETHWVLLVLENEFFRE